MKSGSGKARVLAAACFSVLQSLVVLEAEQEFIPNTRFCFFAKAQASISLELDGFLITFPWNIMV